jgi:hypothetical protein
MKRCRYCGAEYPDDAIVCTIDQTPFDETTPEPVPSIKLPRFGIFSERKIPVSLVLVSYLFFLYGAGPIAAMGFISGFLIFFGNDITSNHILASCLIGGVIAVLAALCLLIFPITMIVAYVIFAICFAVFESHTSASRTLTLSQLTGVAIAILFVYISRGLRMGSRKWRICALAFTWLELATVAFGIIWYFWTPGEHRQAWEATDWLECGVGIILLAWQYRVLTRADVRELFND